MYADGSGFEAQNILVFVRNHFSGLLCLYEQYPQLFSVSRIPKNDKVFLVCEKIPDFPDRIKCAFRGDRGLIGSSPLAETFALSARGESGPSSHRGGRPERVQFLWRC